MTAVAHAQPAFAAHDWPDSVDRYVAQVRNTINTTDMAGYLAVVKNPQGALLIDVRDEKRVQDRTRAGHGSTFRADVWNFGFGRR